jgi:hypothetical protein
MRAPPTARPGVSTPKVERAACPALLTIWSTRPNRARAAAINASGTSAAPRSPRKVSTGEPIASTSAATPPRPASFLRVWSTRGGARPGDGARRRGSDAAAGTGDHHYPFDCVGHGKFPHLSRQQAATDSQYTAFLDIYSIQVPNSRNCPSGKRARWKSSSSVPESGGADPWTDGASQGHSGPHFRGGALRFGRSASASASCRTRAGS